MLSFVHYCNGGVGDKGAFFGLGYFLQELIHRKTFFYALVLSYEPRYPLSYIFPQKSLHSTDFSENFHLRVGASILGGFFCLDFLSLRRQLIYSFLNLYFGFTLEVSARINNSYNFPLRCVSYILIKFSEKLIGRFTFIISVDCWVGPPWGWIWVDPGYGKINSNLLKYFTMDNFGMWACK